NIDFGGTPLLFPASGGRAFPEGTQNEDRPDPCEVQQKRGLERSTHMAENTEVNPPDTPRMETNIVFEAPKKSVGQSIATVFIEILIGLAIFAGLAYAFLNFTSDGEKLKYKYECKSRDTIKSLNDGLEFCRFYASYKGHPPSKDEVFEILMERIRNPRTQYRLPSGKTLPYWNAKDGFGHDISIDVNPQTRTIKLTSPGILPLPGDKPCFFNVIRETSY
ncbi:MAG: hypothetical protein ACI4RA_04760, partial [Kiritimatiellia bacterium]